MYIRYDGNVGIGTTTPEGKLEVAGGFAGVANIFASGRLDAPASYGQVNVGNLFGKHEGLGFIGTRIKMDVSADEGMLMFHTAMAGLLSEKMRINPNGNVGIGTVTPEGKLEVAGGFAGVANIFASGRLDAPASYGQVNVGNLFGKHEGLGFIGTRIKMDVSADEGTLMFHTAMAGLLSEKMRINSNGNVGIGTATPTSKLAVVGLPEFADNAAAASLSVGDFYRTATGVVMVKY